MRTRLLSGVALVLLVGSASSSAENPNIDKEAEKKLLVAFGKDHKGVRDAKFKFQGRFGDSDRVDHVFACDTFEVEADGWVKIAPGYMAIFEDAEGAKARQRLGNKFEAPSMRLRMDPAVKRVGDMARSRIKRIEMPSALVDDFGKP